MTDRFARTTALCLLMSTMVSVPAGALPQVDLSVSVSTTPVPYVPGGHGTVTLTVHNAGPDAAGTTFPGPYAIDVIQDGFTITHNPPPYEIRAPVIGCLITETITEPLPDGNIGLIWEFYFDVIPAGGSRTCTFDIEFYPSTRQSFTTGWLAVIPSDNDTNPNNNRVNYTFLAGTQQVPAITNPGLLVLAIGLLFLAWAFRRRVWMRQ